MRRVDVVLKLILAASALLLAFPSVLRAESAVPDPGAFFAQTPEFDPNAAGTKLTGTLTIAYVFSESLACATPDLPGVPQLTIMNMFVVMTMQKGTDRQPFNIDFTKTTPPTGPICFSTGTQTQIDFVLNLVRFSVIPRFFACVPGAGGNCPPFKIKALSNFLTSGTGAVSANITLAVQQK